MHRFEHELTRKPVKIRPEVDKWYWVPFEIGSGGSAWKCFEIIEQDDKWRGINRYSGIVDMDMADIEREAPNPFEEELLESQKVWEEMQAREAKLNEEHRKWLENYLKNLPWWKRAIRGLAKLIP